MADERNTYHQQLRLLLENARNTVVFTGAGISTESGIPDFRSPGGIWSKFRIIQYDEFLASEVARREDWKRRFVMEDQLGEVRPNDGHMAIARLVDEGRVSHVITQNIDGLHQRAGVPAAKMIELHGNATFAKCLDCALVHDIASIRETLEQTGHPPACSSCGGIVKSAVISFGQQMPAHEMRRAQEATLAADLFLAIGSSLVVYPAAGFPLLAKRNGAIVVIINREATDLDSSADHVFHTGIGDLFRPFLGRSSP
jgi:NAD-dependent deacetylase